MSQVAKEKGFSGNLAERRRRRMHMMLQNEQEKIRTWVWFLSPKLTYKTNNETNKPKLIDTYGWWISGCWNCPLRNGSPSLLTELLIHATNGNIVVAKGEAKSKIASPFRKSCILQPSLHFSHYTQWRSDNWNSTGFQNIWLPFEAHLATWRRLLSASTSHAMDPHLAFPPLRWQIPTKSLPASASSPHVRV